MEYRLIRKPKGVVEVFREEDSEKLGTIEKKRHLLVLSKYILRLEDSTIVITPNFLTRRRWKVGDVKIVLRWFVLGTGISIRFADVVFFASEFKNGKLVFKDTEQGRTGLIINTKTLSSKDSLLLEHYDRFELSVSLIATLLAMKRFKINGW